jgi:serine protease Do
MANLPHLTLRAAICLAGCMLAVQAQTGTGKSLEMLSRFSDGVEALAARVAPSVVQISVTSFGPREEGEGSRTGVVLGRQQSVGSGVIIDPDGYIVTNAHVVANALRIRVTRTMQSAAASLATASAEKPDETVADTLAQALAVPVDATLVGVFRELDLALIKIPAKNLPALRFADYGKLRQGLVVFAFGSREGLGNSMSMGVVSSVARQPFPDSPFVYIQTDAPINPGDSGGPLVNAEGEIVGLDTFILSQSGGSEGIGFAIPSTLTQLAAGKLRKYGHMHRQLIGVGVQTITPTLASALSLSRESGVLVSDVSPGAPAEGAGVKLNDIVLAINGMPVENVPMFSTAMLSLPGGQKVKLDLLRGGEKLSLSVGAVEESHAADRLADMIDPEKNRIRQLGVVGIAIDKQTESLFPGLRGPYGVIVAALAASSAASLTGLQVGDVIHEVNGAAVTSIDELRATIAKFKRGDPVALFIERDGKLQYLAFELE